MQNNMFQTIFKNERYQTVNNRGTSVDKLWRARRCFTCETALPETGHTFCALCKDNFNKQRLSTILRE
jgi:hypothetical protein